MEGEEMRDEGKSVYPKGLSVNPTNGEIDWPQDGISLWERCFIAALESGRCPFERYEFKKNAEWCRETADAMMAEWRGQ